MEVTEFTAMGSACRIVVDGGEPGLAERAVAHVTDLEQRWSRFLPTSEISALNAADGAPLVVSEPTYDLLRHARDAMVLTEGRFNPLMLDQLEAVGYRSGPIVATAGVASRAGTHELLECFDDTKLVRLPNGVRFDPGGIGKGYAADLVTEYLVRRGATTTLVELGGDLRVSGAPWDGDSWLVEIGNPFAPADAIAAFRPTDGAVATSSVLRRRWNHEGAVVHHLLDPATGRPAETDLAAVSVCSSRTWWAEVVAKVAVIAGSDGARDLLVRFGQPGLLVGVDGSAEVVSIDAEVPA